MLLIFHKVSKYDPWSDCEMSPVHSGGESEVRACWQEQGECNARTCNIGAVHPAVGRQKEEGMFQDSRANMCFTMGVKKTCIEII